VTVGALLVTPVLATVPVAAAALAVPALLALAPDTPDDGELAGLPQPVSRSGMTQAMAILRGVKVFALDISKPSVECGSSERQ